MTATHRIPARMLRSAARHPWLALALGLAVVLAGTAGRRVVIDEERTGVPVPLLVYQVEGRSGSHEIGLLNLPIAPLGVVAVPMPVDVNGDLLPDVTVALNLVDVAGLFNNPPDLGAVLAPNLVINRLLPGIPLAPVNAPLRINAKITVLDVGGTEPPTFLRLGYETGQGGSIPSKFKLVASGLTGFFNPVVAGVEAPGYEGPLTLVAGIEQGDERTDADLRFEPFPQGLELSYGTDAAGQTLGITHLGAVGSTAADREVDLDADIRAADGAEVSTIDARVDRLPGSIAVTIRPGAEGSGGFDYVARSDGRLPDLRVDVVGQGAGDDPLIARLDLEALPPELHAEWALPEDGPVHVRFESPVRPLGGVDARVANFAGQPTELDPFIPAQQQFVDFRRAADEDGEDGEDGERLVVARIDGIVLADLTEAERGLDARFVTSGGGLPLELHAALAEVGESKRQLEATTTITPLPADVSVSLNDAGDDELTDPLVIAYDSSDSIDVDGIVEVREPDAAGDPCGAAGTLCASLSIRDIPTSIETRIGSFTNAAGRSEARIAVDDIPRPGATNPDVFADVTFGQADGVPLIAHAELLGIPEHMRVRAVEGADQTTARAEFHACDRDFELSECVEDTEGEVGALSFRLRNFVQRPVGFPIQIAEERNFAFVTARGNPDDPDNVAFEAAGRVVAIRELLYINEDVFGLRTRIGGEEALRALVDIDGVEIGDNLTTLRGDAFVPSVPAVLDLCFRASTDPAVGITDPVTEPCEDPDPFRDEVPLTAAPLSVAYRASREIDIRTEVSFTDHGPEGFVADDFHLDALLDITDLPSEATAHVLVPEEEGAVRAVYDTGQGTGTNDTRIHFEAAATDADLVCRDPRQPAAGDKAFCAEGTIVGLPTRAEVTFDPDVADDNLILTTAGRIDIEDFGLSMVEGELDEDDNLTKTALVLTGQVRGIPNSLRGTLHVPSDEEAAAGDPLAVSFEASPPIDVVEATVQNFVGADPLPSSPPAQRAGLPPVDPIADNYDTVTLLQVGDQMRVSARVTKLERAGYRSYITGQEADPEPDDPTVDGALVTTHVVDLGFGDDRNVRAYVDADDGTERVIADVTLLDRPAGMSMCFRGERATTTVVEEPTFCDTSTATDAAFELTGDPHEAGEALDVHAYFRIADAVSGKLLSGRADVGDLPPILRGSFGGDSDALVEGFTDADDDPDEEDLQPLGIDRLGFRVASFDIADHGYASPPFIPLPQGQPFPAFSSSGQHIGAVVTDAHLDVRGLIGPPTAGADGSRLQRLRLSDDICPTPDGVDDYPQYPPVPAPPVESPYTCAEIDFEQVGTVADPLAIGFVLDKGGRDLRVRDGLLSDIPTHVQLMLADLPGTVGDDPTTAADESVFLDRCPTGTGTPAPGSCVPPLLRFDADTPGSVDPILAAVVELGDSAALASLDAVPVPATDLPNLAASPTPAGWSEWGSDPRGVRLAMAPVPGAGDENALRAGIRIPLPDALTVFPFQSWDDARTSDSAADPAFWVASDLAFAYEATIDGQTIPSLGRLAAVIRDEEGAHIVATDGGETAVAVTDTTGTPPVRQPLGIPGEFDLALYRRENKLLGRQLIQLDGRVNAATDLRFQMIPPNLEDGDVPLDAYLINLQPEQTVDQTDPSFRLRVELLTAPESPGDPPEDPPSGCPEFIVGTCSSAEVVVQQASALFDMAPDANHVTRLLQAAVRVDDQTGVQIQAFSEIDGDAGGADPDALVSGELGIHLDPMNIDWGGGFVLGARVEVKADFRAFVLLDRVSDFSLRQSVVRLSVENKNNVDDGNGNPAEGNGVIVPLMDPTDLEVDVWLDLYFFDLDLFGLTWLDSIGADDEPVTIDFEECSLGSQLLGTVFDPLAGVALLLYKSFESLTDGSYDTFERRGLGIRPGESQDVYAVPDAFTDPRLAFEILGFIPIPMVGGMLAELLDFLVCIPSAPDHTLIDPALGFPADTISVPGHPVPDAVISVELPEGSIDASEDPLVIGPTDIVALCGNRRYPTVDVEGVLVVGTTPAEGCPGGSVGELRLSADDIHVHSGGQIIQASDGTLSLIGDVVTIDGSVTSSNGPITIHGNQTMSIPGSVTADGASEAVPLGPDGDPLGQLPSGNGGGGHGDNDRDGTIFDSGGDGAGISGSDGGGSYGDDSSRSQGIEMGSPGVGNGRGFGGGAITLTGNSIVIDGQVTANGTDASNFACDSAQTLPGGGGGSGGGIVIAGAAVSIAPESVYATGGNGGSSPAGGGGGGGGGVIKILSPQYDGPLPVGPSGGNGGGGCDEDDGNDGEDIDDVISDLGPQSQFERYDGLWVTEDTDPGTPAHELMGRFSGAQPTDGVDDFNVAVCASFLPAEWALADHDDDDLPDGAPTREDFLMPHPSTVEEEHPCGEASLQPPGCSPICTPFIGGRLLATTQIENANSVLFDPDDPNSPGQVLLDELENDCFGDTDFDCPEGFWGVWTMIVTTTVDGNDCYDDDDEAEDDEDACAAEEQQPLFPDVVFGIDNTDSDVTAASVEESDNVVRFTPTGNTWYTTAEEIAFTIEATDLVDNQPAPLSGLAEVRCAEVDAIRAPGVAVPFDCHLGRNVHRFATPGDGFKSFVITVVDDAGNQNRVDGAAGFGDFSVVRDLTAPIGSPGLFGPHAVIDPGLPDGANGWYRTTPQIELLTAIDTDNSDGSQGVGPPLNEPDSPVWRYRYDTGEEQACADVPEERQAHTDDGCQLLDEPTLGVHVLHFTATDRLGNRLVRDSEDPSQVMFHTDELRIDAVPPTSTLLTVPLAPNGANGWFVTEPFVVLSAVDQPGASGLTPGPDDDDTAGLYYRLDGGPETRFTEPFRLTAGMHQVCWRAVDVAGNADVGVAGVEPSILQYLFAGHCRSAMVDTADPVAALAVSPASPDGDAGWYLAPPSVSASATDTVPGSGVVAADLMVSFDGKPFVPFTAPIVVPEGLHDVRAFATDGAGRRSAVVAVDLTVDESGPTTAARLVPPDPARAGWWRRLPMLVLRATDGDQNAGLARIEYALDGGGFATYTVPLEIPAGTHDVRYRAVDHAGRTGVEQQLTVPVDTGSPLAVATQSNPLIWSQLLGPATAKLQWQIGDDRSTKVRVTVLVVDLFGNVVRRIDGGVKTVVPGVTLNGFTNWDGRDNAGNLVPAGVFHYRVVVTDEAGHRSQSGESRPLQIKLL